MLNFSALSTWYIYVLEIFVWTMYDFLVYMLSRSLARPGMTFFAIYAWYIMFRPCINFLLYMLGTSFFGPCMNFLLHMFGTSLFGPCMICFAIICLVHHCLGHV